MITKHIYGTPIDTQAVVVDVSASEEPVQYLSADKSDKGITFSYQMNKEDAVYGLGEAVRGINKRGWRYESFCTDDPNHTETKRALYGAHNFIIVSGKEQYGIFVDTPARATFDIGYTEQDKLYITACEPDLTLYILTGESECDIVTQFRRITGQSYLAPRWAFGFQQSRWGYQNAQDIKNVTEGYRESGIPLDAVYMDIDYMQRFKDFTIDESKFPDFTEFVSEMKQDGIRLVPIIDAGVKIEEGYDVCGEGIKNGYFCKDENGSDYVTAVWPGHTYFPDFLNNAARRWFGEKYKALLECGIEGFWNDMNEPAIFYSEKGMERAWQELETYKGKSIDIHSFFDLRDVFGRLSNSMEDYESFYHNMDGIKIRHDKVHNLYGYYMTRSASEAFDRLEPQKRILMFSRSSYIGMHRCSGIWTGDNQSWWSHLLLNIKMMPSLNMCGFLYTGADIGGFGGDCTRDLLLRWLAFGVFTPLMRNHSAMGTREQECYKFGDTQDFKNIISVRYRLIPYLYSEYMKAAMNAGMMFRPLAFDYNEDRYAKTVEDQLMLGDSVMVTPVYEQNAAGRYVYLPEDMLFVVFGDPDRPACKVMKKGHHYIDVALGEVPLFIKRNHVVPLCDSAQCTDKLNLSRLSLIGLVTDKSEYRLYDDDGLTKTCSPDRIITISAVNNGGTFEINSSDCAKTVSNGGLIDG